MSSSGGGERGRDDERKKQVSKRRAARRADADNREGANAGDAGGALGAIDWTEMKARVRQAMRYGKTGTPKPGSDPSTRFDSNSLDDIVQEAIAEQLAAWDVGQPRPVTLEELEAALIIRARRRRKAWAKRARERRTNLGLLAPTLSIKDLFEFVCESDEQNKFFEALADLLDAEAQDLLDKLLRDGIPFGATKALAAECRTSVTHVTNMKRRIMSHARQVMTTMLTTPRIGGPS